jgi:tetratricopeptide (TPR) repeat protein
MSLLMDALKKAEQEKKAAAERLKEAQNKLPHKDDQVDRVISQELTIEDLSGEYDKDVEEPTPAVENRDKLDVDKPDVKSKLEDLSLSPIAHQQPSAEENEQLAKDDKLALEDGEITVSESAPVEAQTLALNELQVDETVETATDDAEDITQADQTFNSDTLSDGSSDYFSTTVSAAQLAEDIGGDAPTPVAAQTVFTATSTSSSNQMFQWGVFAIICLVIAVSLSFFVFNYTVPVERSIKSPLVARGIETPSEPMPAFEIPDEIVSGAGVDSNLFTGEITDVIEIENDTVVDVQEQPAAENILQTGENNRYPADEISLDDYAINDEPIEDFALSLPEKITPEPELIKISRSKSVDKSSALVNKAYEDYLAGNFDSAEEIYHVVLNNLPENRDALLGLAAVSIQRGDLRQAYIHYLEVLRLYPGDSVAEAALINFNEDRNQSRNESILKTFLQNEPDNSFLHYSLARLYAAQTRWPEAQQSFFDAHRIESSNADYAFNLAVSLEHVGQQQSAIDYYNVALELSQNPAVSFTTSSFDRAAVISRINTLSHQADLR